MFKNLFSWVKPTFERSANGQPNGQITPKKSLNAKSSEPATSKSEILKQNANLICKTLHQLIKRQGLDPQDFSFQVGFQSATKKTFKTMVNIPADAELSHLRCKAIEETAVAELRIRHNIQLASIYWRIKDDDESSYPSFRPSSLVDLGVEARGIIESEKKSATPQSWNAIKLDAEPGFLTEERSLTHSEFLEFDDLRIPVATAMPDWMMGRPRQS